MKTVIGWLTAGALFASPCAWDTSQRELLDRVQHKPLQLTLPLPVSNPLNKELA